MRAASPRDVARPPDTRRATHERHGRVAETVAAIALVCRGYRILARRHRNRYGEIDLIGVRGRRLAFVEVKYRATVADAEQTLVDLDPRRLHAAAEHWCARRPGYADHDMGFDAILVMPRRWPKYCRDALQPQLNR